MALQLEFFDQNLKVLRNRALQLQKIYNIPPRPLSLRTSADKTRASLYSLIFFINEIIKRHKSLIGFFLIVLQSRYLREHVRGRTRKQSNNYFQQQPKSQGRIPQRNGDFVIVAYVASGSA